MRKDDYQTLSKLVEQALLFPSLFTEEVRVKIGELYQAANKATNNGTEFKDSYTW